MEVDQNTQEQKAEQSYLENTLKNMQSPDRDTRNSATVAITEFFQREDFLKIFAELIVTTKDAGKFTLKRHKISCCYFAKITNENKSKKFHRLLHRKFRIDGRVLNRNVT